MRFIADALRRWIERRRKAVFVFWDGFRTRRIDPMVAYRRLRTHPEFDWSSTPKMLEVPDEKERLDATRLIAVAVREAFEVPPMDSEGNGLTESMCVQLLSRFTAWIAVLAKKRDDSQTSRRPMATSRSEKSAAETTVASSVSGSTSDVPV